MRRSIFIVVLLGALSNCAVAAASSNTTITTHSTPRGKVLSTSRGFSLYMRSNDKQGRKGKAAKSTCYGKCAKTLRPLLVKMGGKLVAAGGAKDTLPGTVRRAGGSTQVTYDGWPLYTDVSDIAPGFIDGEAAAQFGGRSYLLTAMGRVLRGCPPGFRLTLGGCLTDRY
jgi:predicted lipoprotein with Yx(FWY)xxD motif